MNNTYILEIILRVHTFYLSTLKIEKYDVSEQ